MSIQPPSTFVVTRTPIVDKTGYATWSFLKILQGWETKLENGLNSIGQITQPIPDTIPIAGRSEPLAVTVQNIDSNGVITDDGIDFAREYVHKTTDYIHDGSGSPLNGGKAAEIALVTNPPSPQPHQWVNGLQAGLFTQSQPEFADIDGQATAAQVPPLSELNGQITTAQLPPEGISVTIITAPITLVGLPGSMTFTNGILTDQTQAT